MGRRSHNTAKQKAEVVLSVLSKQTTIAEACRRHGITETTFARWREQAVTAMEKGLEDRGGGASGREASWSARSRSWSASLGQLALIADLGEKLATVNVRQRVELPSAVCPLLKTSVSWSCSLESHCGPH